MNEVKIIQMHHKRMTIVMDDILYCLMYDVQKVSDKIIENIEKVSGLLVEHQGLYTMYVKPCIECAPARYVTVQANRASMEFWGLMTEFSQYKDRWATAQLINERPLDFAIESRNIIEELKVCLQRKDYDVLPLLFRERLIEMAV